ncbi:MAG: cytochrome c biogenesis protein CcsA [Elusimicrobiota bacterium]
MKARLKRHLHWLLPLLLAVPIVKGLRVSDKSVKPGFSLDSFAALPVLHDGRTKPLDAIARNSLLVLRNKQTYRGKDAKLTAVEWLLELMADPASADRRKVFVIHDPDILGLLGMRRAAGKYFSFKDLEPFADEVARQAAVAGRIDPKRRSRFQRAVYNLDSRLAIYHRLKASVHLPDRESFLDELSDYGKALVVGRGAFMAHSMGGGTSSRSKAMRALGPFFQRYNFQSQAAYFRLVPPAPGRPAEEWMNAGEAMLSAMRSGDIPPEMRGYGEALEAYKNGDAGAFSSAVGALTKRVAQRAPRAARFARYEARFNGAEPFYQGMVLYVVVFLLICVSWIAWPETLRKTAFNVLVLACVVHSAGLFARMWIQGRPPVTNLYSSAVFVGWGAVLFGVILERMHRKGIGSLVSSIIGFCTLIVAHHLSMSGDTMGMMVAVLDSNFWLGTHVITITIGYSSMFLAALLAHIYVFRQAAGRLDKSTAGALSQMLYGVTCFSLLLSFIGTMLGGIWADQSWGRFWGWDPKENGALLIVLWCAVILHARWGGWIRDRGLAVCSIIGGIITSFSWFGVNMLGIGLHSYGFMDKAFVWLMVFTASQLAVIGLAFVPPSFLAGWLKR